MNLFPEITAAEIADVSPPTPPRADTWIVIGVCVNSFGEGVWTQPSAAKGMYTSREAAEKAASKLASLWTVRRIVRIPGEG